MPNDQSHLHLYEPIHVEFGLFCFVNTQCFLRPNWAGFRTAFQNFVETLRAWKPVTNGQGAAVIEYALMVAGMSLAIATVVFTLGDDLVTLFENNTIEQAGTN